MLSLAAACGAHAQASLTATVESEYRFRGVALNNGKADVRLGVAYDHRSGAYAGASVIVGEGARGDIHALGYVAHAGFARRTASGLTWDVGATNSQIIDNIPVKVTLRSPQGAIYTRTFNYRYKANYNEIYGGLIKGPLSAHLYFSPDYLGEGLRTAYLDVNAGVRPARRVRLFGHVGLLAPLGGQDGRASRQVRYDLRTGVALELGRAELQLAWTAVRPRLEYPAGYPQKRSALVASATVFF